MTNEQVAAYVIGQAALLNAEVARMQAENSHRLDCGHSIAYGDEQFAEVIARFEPALSHNAVFTMVNEATP